MYIFCQDTVTNLSRHITRKHNENAHVKEALKIGRKECKAEFDKFRKEGIYQANMQKMSDPGAVFDREYDIVMCTSCKGFYARTFYYRHSRHCLDSCPPVLVLPCQLKEKCDFGVSQEFKECILNIMCNDEVGMLCKSDETIITVGSYLFEKIKRKLDKEMEVRRSVRNDMRRLGNLYREFKQSEGVKQVFHNACDMFRRENFLILTKAIDTYTKKNEDRIKAGLKFDLFYLIKSLVKAMKGTYLIKNEDCHAHDIEDFLSVLEFNSVV